MNADAEMNREGREWHEEEIEKLKTVC